MGAEREARRKEERADKRGVEERGEGAKKTARGIIHKKLWVEKRREGGKSRD